jgi:hypothetical protein
MRPVLAVAIWIVIIGGLAGYMQVREQARAVRTIEAKEASGTFALEVTISFPLEPDPFALRSGAEQPAALILKLNGSEILRVNERVDARKPITLDPVPHLHVGPNEFYIEANPPVDSIDRPYAVRVRLMRDGQSAMDRSFWAEPGARIADAFAVEVQEARAKEEHPHAH